jgi:hypothetical protein
MSAMLTERCTRCTCVGYIKSQGVLEFGVRYSLCANCSSVYQSLDSTEAAERFAQDVWRKSVVHSRESARTVWTPPVSRQSDEQTRLFPEY